MSYTFSGLKWGGTTLETSSGTITWTVDWSGLTSHTGAEADFQASLEYAFQQWEDAAAIIFADTGIAYNGGSNDADITIFFGNIDGRGTIAAETSGIPASWSGGALYPAGDMTIKFDNSETWDPSTGVHLDFTIVALHELGHVLGLDHTSDDAQIMFDTIDSKDSSETLGDGDIFGAQVLYGRDETDPDIADPGIDPGSGVPANSGGGGLAVGAGGLIMGLVGILWLIVGGISGVSAAVVAAMRIGPEDNSDGDAPEASAQDYLPPGFDLGDVITVTALLGDEALPEEAAEDEPEEGLLALL